MRYRSLGRTGLQISEIGFGGAPAGLPNYLGAWNPADPASAESVAAAIQTAVAHGINYFDTAPGYGDGASERMFGVGIRPHRAQVLIATKFFAVTAEDVRRSADESLARLGVEHIDVLQYHGSWYTQEIYEQIMAPGGVLEGLQSLKAEGLVRFIGFTTEGVSGAVSQLIASGAFDVIQLCYNLIYQHPYDPSRKAGIMLEAEQQGMGIVVMRPLTSGIFPKWLAHALPEALQTPEHQARLRAALLGFVLSNPYVNSALVGMRTPAEAVQNAALSEDDALRVDLDWLHERYV